MFCWSLWTDLFMMRLHFVIVTGPNTRLFYSPLSQESPMFLFPSKNCLCLNYFYFDDISTKWKNMTFVSETELQIVFNLFRTTREVSKLWCIERQYTSRKSECQINIKKNDTETGIPWTSQRFIMKMNVWVWILPEHTAVFNIITQNCFQDEFVNAMLWLYETKDAVGSRVHQRFPNVLEQHQRSRKYCQWTQHTSH